MIENGLVTRCNAQKTIVTVTTASAQLVPANPTRRFLQWMVLGDNDVTVEPGAGPAVAGSGMTYSAAGAGKQGGSESYLSVVPVDAFQCVCASGTSTVVVWEGV